MSAAVVAAPGSPRIDLIERLRQSDWIRGSTPRLDGRRIHKEWLHVNVLAPGVEVYVNLNLMDDQRPAARKGARDARTIVLVREPGRGWDGGIVVHPESAITTSGRGRVALAFADDRIELDDGALQVRATIPARRVSVDLRLVPLTAPMLGPNTPLDDGMLHWLVVPRLAASGTVTVDGRLHVLHAAPAYHDHNWGEFLWGHDLSWEWGFGVPPDPVNPWSCVFVRFSDRRRAVSRAQGLFLWRGAEQHRTFRERELTIRAEGRLAPTSIKKFPPVMGLLRPDRPTDVPARFHLLAEGRGDRVEGVFVAQDVAQIVIPTETDLSVTVINEVSGRLTLRGQVRGEDLEIDGAAVFEFLSL